MPNSVPHSRHKNHKARVADLDGIFILSTGWPNCWTKTETTEEPVEILSHFSLAHTRFQKFLKISKPMCVSPCDMQPMFLAAQKQGVGSKFSPTWKVGRDVDQHTRWGVAPLGKWVRREVPHVRSSSSSVSTRLDSTRLRGLRNWASEPSLSFCCIGKPSIWPSPGRTRHS
jgi:hypothetical protein